MANVPTVILWLFLGWGKVGLQRGTPEVWGVTPRSTCFLNMVLGWKQKLLAYSLRRDTAVKVCLGLLVKSTQELLPSLLKEIALGAYAP